MFGIPATIVLNWLVLNLYCILQLDSEILLRGQFESLKKKKHPVILYPFPSRGSSVTYGCLSKKNTLLFDEGPLTCWMSVLRVPSLAGCQF